MRGRTIYFQNRRILVFCGKKRIQPHSMNDRFGAAKEETLFGENVEIKNTDSVLAKAENGVAVGDTDEPLITSGSRFPNADGELSLEDVADALNTVTRLALYNNGVEINHEADALGSVSRLPSYNGGIETDHVSHGLGTRSVFGESVEDVTFGHNGEALKTEISVFGEGSETSTTGETVEGFTDNSAFDEAAENIGLSHNAEAYIETPVATGDFVSFSSDEPFTIQTVASAKTWSGTIEYSTDAETWTVWDGRTAIGGEKRLYMRGSNNTAISYPNRHWSATATAGIKVQGVLESLLDYTTVANGGVPTKGEYAFYCLFLEWDKLIDAGDLVILSLTGDTAFSHLFGSCTALEKAPLIREAQIGRSTCRGMFYRCFGLVNPPQMVITALDSYSCQSMFAYCNSLVSPVPMRITGEIGYEACYEMYKGCTSLTKLPAFTALTYKEQALYRMFAECSKVKISSSQTGAYQNAFRIPTSGTGTLVSGAFNDMFVSTGGTFSGTPTINRTYYTSNEIIS